MNKTVVLDIDGVLADYRLGLLWWVNSNYPELRDKCYTHLYSHGTWINDETMGVSYRMWLDILEHFRMSGGKQTIPVFPGAPELVNYLRLKQYKIVLITSRPIDIYSNIYRDTLEWLRTNKPHHDLLLWARNKAELIYKLRMIDDIYFAVDDEVSHIKAYDALGIATYWLDRYNKAAETNLLLSTQVKTIDEILIKEGLKCKSN